MVLFRCHFLEELKNMSLDVQTFVYKTFTKTEICAHFVNLENFAMINFGERIISRIYVYRFKINKNYFLQYSLKHFITLLCQIVGERGQINGIGEKLSNICPCGIPIKVFEMCYTVCFLKFRTHWISNNRKIIFKIYYEVINYFNISFTVSNYESILNQARFSNKYIMIQQLCYHLKRKFSVH